MTDTLTHYFQACMRTVLRSVHTVQWGWVIETRQGTIAVHAAGPHYTSHLHVYVSGGRNNNPSFYHGCFEWANQIAQTEVYKSLINLQVI